MSGPKGISLWVLVKKEACQSVFPMAHATTGASPAASNSGSGAPFCTSNLGINTQLDRKNIK